MFRSFERVSFSAVIFDFLRGFSAHLSAGRRLGERKSAEEGGREQSVRHIRLNTNRKLEVIRNEMTKPISATDQS